MGDKGISKCKRCYNCRVVFLVDPNDKTRTLLANPKVVGVYCSKRLWFSDSAQSSRVYRNIKPIMSENFPHGINCHCFDG